MPIYDNNGTTSAEIGKLYDNNGTTSYQIDEVYDNNGTTNSLIYNAEEQLFPNGQTWENLPLGDNWHIDSLTTSSIIIRSGWTNNDTSSAYVITSNAVDLTDYTTLSVTFNIAHADTTSNWYNYWRLGINPTKTWTGYTYAEKLISKSSNGAGTYTITYDVSAVHLTAHSRLKG